MAMPGAGGVGARFAVDAVLMGGGGVGWSDAGAAWNF